MKKFLKITLITIIISLSILPVTQQVHSQDTILNDELPLNIFLPLVLKNDALSCSVPPTLIAPANGNVLDTLSPIFRWDNGVDPTITSVVVQVAIDPEFEYIHDSLYYMTGPGEYDWQFLENFHPGTTYHWRAWLYCQNGEFSSPYSEVWTFTTPDDVDILPAPTLLSPPDGTILESCPVMLRWEPVDGAEKYRVRTSQTSFISSWSTRYVENTEDQFYCQYYDSETITWEITAIGPEAIGEVSEHWTFTTPPAETSGFSAPLGAPQFILEKDGITSEYEFLP